ncbi:MAG: TraR/DksA C4-type zinc finger protein [Verrucomicrobiales bacterium]|nr:TraR/DksA C4-type zinc finger protein [Verrucomicrobiales bacterium]
MAKKATTRKSPAKKATAKSATKKATAESGETSKAASKKKTTARKTVKKVAVAKKIPSLAKPVLNAAAPVNGSNGKPAKLPAAFLKKQQQKLLDLRDNLVDQMNGVARDTLRGAGDDGSAFGMHQADAGSDSYDRDFALNLLSQEQDALEEIDEALKRIDMGTYGICDISGEPIPQMRLEAMPFARRTVACQEKLDLEEARGYHRQPVTSLFGLDEKEKTVSDN